MEIEISGQKKQINELKYLDAVEVEETKQKDGLRAAIKKFLVKSGLTEEESENLSLKDGLKIQQELNKISQDFQEPPKKESEQN